MLFLALYLRFTFFLVTFVERKYIFSKNTRLNILTCGKLNTWGWPKQTVHKGELESRKFVFPSPFTRLCQPLSLHRPPSILFPDRLPCCLPHFTPSSPSSLPLPSFSSPPPFSPLYHSTLPPSISTLQLVLNSFQCLEEDSSAMTHKMTFAVQSCSSTASMTAPCLDIKKTWYICDCVVSDDIRLLSP